MQATEDRLCNTLYSLLFKTYNSSALAVGFIYPVLVYYLLQGSAHCAVESLQNNLPFQTLEILDL